MENGSAYPATLTITTPDRVDNWRPLVQWLLAIPHFVVVYVLGIVSSVVAVISWFVILFTGRLGSGLSGYQAMYLRYSWRTSAFAGWLTVDYPPFGFGASAADPGDYEPLRVETELAEEDRNRLTTFFRWILVIPHVVVLTVVGIVASVFWLVALFTVLFTGRWPDGLRKFVVGYLRWMLRVEAYWLLLTDEYPPFSLD